MLRYILAAVASLVSIPSIAQTMTVTINGREYAVAPGATTTFVTDGNGTRVVSTTQVAVASTPPSRPRPARYQQAVMRTEADYVEDQGDAPSAYARPAYAPPAYATDGGPRLAYADPDADSLEPALGGSRVLRIKRDRYSGHFIAAAIMNGVRIKAIIDTGASGTIISPEDAAATGADKDVHSSRPGVGIGGYTTLYMTKVRDLEIGGQHLGSFKADIGQRGIPHTLLGTPELSKLGRIVLEGDVMTIYPKGVQMASR